MNISKQFSAMIFEMSQVELSQELQHTIKQALLDYLGVSVAGAIINQSKAILLAKSLGDAGNIQVAGMPHGGYSMQTAALLAGLLSHSIELDDGNRFAMMHPGSVVISALLSVAQQHTISEKKLLQAIAIGYEASIRLATSMQPSHKLKGYHATATCGSVGAAIAVSVALGHSQEQIENCLSAASLHAGGLLESICDDSQLKPLNAGRAAQSALVSAWMAQAGFKGPTDALGGSRGFMRVMSDSFDSQKLFTHQSNWSIESCYYKPYAACRHCHAPIEAALLLVNENTLSYDDIDSILVETYDLAVRGHDHCSVLTPHLDNQLLKNSIHHARILICLFGI